MIIPTSRILNIVKRCLCKAEDSIPEVDAAIVLLSLIASRHWEQSVDRAMKDLLRALDQFEDERVAVEPVASFDDPEKAAGALAAALFLLIEQQVSAPLGLSDARRVEDIADRLLAAGARSLELPKASNTEAALVSVAQARAEFVAIFPWHLETVKTRSVEAIKDFLLQKENRISVPGTEVLAGRQAWEQRMRDALGSSSSFIQIAVDTWAYRNYNIGAFQAAEQSGAIGVVVFNNWPYGPDGRTSVICNALHGSTVTIAAASSQIEEYRKAIQDADFSRAAVLWPLLRITGKDDKPSAAEIISRLGNGLGLPPYHRKCRTSIRPIYS